MAGEAYQVLVGHIVKDVHPHACYISVNCAQYEEPILSVKATFADFDRDDLHQGDIVAVQRTSGGYKGWKLIRVYPMSTAITSNNKQIKKDSEMPKGQMSKDRVKFFLPKRYYSKHTSTNGMRDTTCRDVLVKAFGYGTSYWLGIMTGNPEGFHIRCRPSQFARFIIYRHEAGECINGVRDLQPKLEYAGCDDTISIAQEISDRLADCYTSNPNAGDVQRVLDLAESIKLKRTQIINVSTNPASE